MYAIIASEEFYNGILKAVAESGNQVTIESKGALTSDALNETIKNIARTPVLILIIDMNVSEDINIVRAVKLYRRLRPNARIIVLAADKFLGDPYISKIVQKQVFDIANPETINLENDEINNVISTSLINTIKSKNDYSSVAKWELDSDDLEILNTKKEIEIKEISILPEDYKKISAFNGLKGKGRSSLIDLIARDLSTDIKVVVLDLSSDKYFYNKYTWGNIEISNDEKDSISNLIKGKLTGTKVNNNYFVYSRYTDCSFHIDSKSILKIIEGLKNNYAAVILDIDFDSNLDFLNFCSNVFLVHDLSIFDIVELRDRVHKIIEHNIGFKDKIELILNKFVNSVGDKEDVSKLFLELLQDKIEGDEKEIKFLRNSPYFVNFSNAFYLFSINKSNKLSLSSSESYNINSQLQAISHKVYYKYNKTIKRNYIKRILESGVYITISGIIKSIIHKISSKIFHGSKF